MKRDYWVTVCAECLQASCWQGEFYCQRAKSADTMRVRASYLRKARREHPSYYTRARLIEVCGAVEDAP